MEFRRASRFAEPYGIGLRRAGFRQVREESWFERSASGLLPASAPNPFNRRTRLAELPVV